MVLGDIRKQPADVLDYDIDFSKWIISGDNIEHINVDITRNDGSVITADDLAVKAVFNNDPVIKVWLEKGVDGEAYKVEITITTVEGRTKQVELRARLRDI